MKIKVKFHIKSWAGLEKKFPPPIEKELDLSKGDKLGAKDFGGFLGSAFVITSPSFEVSDINDSGLEITTNGLAERNPDKTINLRKESHGLKHHIDLGQSLELVTQSMDSGFSISITPLEIIGE